MGFDLSKYKVVADRIEEFWEKYPDGAIETELVDDRIINIGTEAEPDFVNKVVFKAILAVPSEKGVNGYRVLATGYATEADNDTKIAKFFENCETSAVGRALANANFGVKNADGTKTRPSREEMESAERAGGSEGQPVKRKIFGKKR